MSTPIEDIERLCIEEKNRPGTDTEISIIPICGVESIPEPAAYDPLNPELAHTATGDIVLKSGYVFRTWEFRKKEAEYKATDEGDEDAETVKVEIKFFIPRIDSFKSYVTNKARNGEWLVLIKDRNNTNPRIVGEVGNGAKIKVTEQTNPKNGYSVAIMCEDLDEKPFFYSGAIVTS